MLITSEVDRIETWKLISMPYVRGSYDLWRKNEKILNYPIPLSSWPIVLLTNLITNTSRNALYLHFSTHKHYIYNEDVYIKKIERKNPHARITFRKKNDEKHNFFSWPYVNQSFY